MSRGHVAGEVAIAALRDLKAQLAVSVSRARDDLAEWLRSDADRIAEAKRDLELDDAQADEAADRYYGDV